MCNNTLTQRVKMIEREVFNDKTVDNSLVEFLYGERRDIYASKITKIPLLYRWLWTNFETNLSPDSIVFTYLGSQYNAALNKLIAAYGTLGLINRRIEEFDDGAKYIIYRIFESTNDLRYSTFRFTKNLREDIIACQSPYAREVMIDIYKSFTTTVTHVFAEESALFDVLHPKEKTPERIALEQANLDANWKRRLSLATESVKFRFTDERGYAKPVDARELDEIRVGIQDIDSVEDKVFLLERLHEQSGRAEHALTMLSDPKLAHKVKQTKGELLKKQEEMELIRQLIFKAPVGRMRYGLFIKYPQGYEG
jgi:hypothetical protein